MEFTSKGSLERHIKLLITCNRRKPSGFYRALYNFSLDLRTQRHILMAVLQPSLEYGCEVWNANKSQSNALESMHAVTCQ